MAITNSILEKIGGTFWERFQGYTRVQDRNGIISVSDNTATFVKPLVKPIRTRLTAFDDDGNEVAVVICHVATNISHNFNTTISQYPVENDSAISDHIVNENANFSVSAIFSKSSQSMVSDNTGDELLKEEDAYQLLQDIRTNGYLVTLLTPLQIFENLLITSLSVPKNPGVGRSLQVEISFQQIRKVGTATTVVFQAPKSTAGVTDASSKTGDMGSKAGLDIAEEEIESVEKSYTALGFLTDTASESLSVPAIAGRP